MSTFTGFSEADLQRMKLSQDTKTNRLNGQINSRNGMRPSKVSLKTLPSLDSDEVLGANFDKCKLSLKTPTSPDLSLVSELNDKINYTINENNIEMPVNLSSDASSRKSSTNITPDVIKCLDNYTEDESEVHIAKLEELQMKQKLMEEQNKKRKEMLSKALADRTKQTEEEVLKLEKIKKELEILDSQLTKDVSLLRKKIDQACIYYSEAEKHYLKVEKEFLQAKINLQKEKEKKELLIEHLCTLITHNETRKAEKLETLMSELANSKDEINNVNIVGTEGPATMGDTAKKAENIVEFYIDV